MRILLFIILGVTLRQASAGAICYDGPDYPLCISCGGSCVADIGCYCDDYETQCVPNECMMQSNECCSILSGWYYDLDQSCCTQEFQCVPRCASDEICVNISTQAVCTCNDTIYKDIKPSNLTPYTTCDDFTMVTSLSKCQLKVLGFNFSSVHLIDPSTDCLFTYPDIVNNIRVWSLQVKATLGWCGNIAWNTSSQIYFVNTETISANLIGNLITKNPIHFNFSCIYNLTMQDSLNITLHPIMSTIYITPPSASGNGSFPVTLAAYSNKECTQPIQESDTVFTGSDVYLGLFSPYADGNSFTLRAEKCFATPSSNRNDTTNVQLVNGGCAKDGDVSVSVLENGVSLEARIKISVFLFNGYTDVYIFCDVRICSKNEDCSKCGGERSAGSVYTGLGIKLNIEDTTDLSSSGYFTDVSWVALASSLLAYFFIKIF